MEKLLDSFKISLLGRKCSLKTITCIISKTVLYSHDRLLHKPPRASGPRTALLIVLPYSMEGFSQSVQDYWYITENDPQLQPRYHSLSQNWIPERHLIKLSPQQGSMPKKSGPNPDLITKLFDKGSAICLMDTSANQKPNYTYFLSHTLWTLLPRFIDFSSWYKYQTYQTTWLLLQAPDVLNHMPKFCATNTECTKPCDHT